MTLHPKYITDENGKKVSVILSINEYNQLLTELDELEDLKLFDAAKESDSGERFSMEDVFASIESKRNLKS
jgi:hypothetical protein